MNPRPPLPILVAKYRHRVFRRSLDVVCTHTAGFRNVYAFWKTYMSPLSVTIRPSQNLLTAVVTHGMLLDRPVVGRAAPHSVRVLSVPVVRHRLADGHGPVQPDVRAQDLDQRVHGAAGRAHHGAGIRGMWPVAGQRVLVAGHDRQRSVHVRPAVHNGRSVAELCQWVGLACVGSDRTRLRLGVGRRATHSGQCCVVKRKHSWNYCNACKCWAFNEKGEVAEMGMSSVSACLG